MLFLLMIMAACSTPPAVGLMSVSFAYDGVNRTALASRPKKTTGKSPVVILVTPDLRYTEFRTNTNGTNRYLEIYDHYLNNAGISLVRFSQRRQSPITLTESVRATGALITVLRKAAPGRRITLLTFGSAAYTGLLLAGSDPDLGLVLVGPPFRDYSRILRWRLLEEPNRHFGSCFDMDGDGRVTRREFEQDTYRVRDEFYRGIGFRMLDRDRDGSITAADFALANRSRYTRVLSALRSPGKPDGDATRILGPMESIRWTASVVAFSKTNSVAGLLGRIKQGAHVFHGNEDRMIPAGESRLLETRHIPGVTVHIEGGHDHELNRDAYSMTGRLPRGMFFLFKALFRLSGTENK